MSFKSPTDYLISKKIANANNGAYKIPRKSFIRESISDKQSVILFIAIQSDGEGWEHVSVSTKNRCPTWKEMCAIKDLFWDEEDVVVQYHPKRSDYINIHKYCLHLWRPIDMNITVPPLYLV